MAINTPKSITLMVKAVSCLYYLVCRGGPLLRNALHDRQILECCMMVLQTLHAATGENVDALE